jgi:hypothetical protein
MRIIWSVFVAEIQRSVPESESDFGGLLPATKNGD